MTLPSKKPFFLFFLLIPWIAYQAQAFEDDPREDDLDQEMRYYANSSNATNLIDKLSFFERQKQAIESMTKTTSRFLKRFRSYQKTEKEVEKKLLECTHKKTKNTEEAQCDYFQKKEKETAQAWIRKLENLILKIQNNIENYPIDPNLTRHSMENYEKIRKEASQEARAKLEQAKEYVEKRNALFDKQYALSKSSPTHLKRKVKKLKKQIKKLSQSETLVVDHENLKPLLPAFLLYSEVLTLEAFCQEKEALEINEGCHLLRPLLGEAQHFVDSARNEIKKIEHLLQKNTSFQPQYKKIQENLKKRELANAIKLHDQLLTELKKSKK
jgi:hypothetical protein